MNYKTKMKFISWNVRGINEREKRIAIRQTILLEKPDILCLQETKIATMNRLIVREACGARLTEFRTLDAIGTRGGVLIAWLPVRYTILDEKKRAYSISILFKINDDNSTFWFTGIYGPSDRSNRRDFFEELNEIKPQSGP